jgi:NAD(P)H-flavin reductase
MAPTDLNATVIQRIESPATTHIFLCGHPAMIEQMVELLEAEGYREHSRREAGQIHVERYW